MLGGEYSSLTPILLLRDTNSELKHQVLTEESGLEEWPQKSLRDFPKRHGVPVLSFKFTSFSKKTLQCLNVFIYFLGVGWDLVHLICQSVIGLLYQPWMIDQYGAIGGMRISRGNRSPLRKSAPLPLCPPQIPLNLTWDWTWATVMGSRWLTASAVAWPMPECKRFTVMPGKYA
jgi:hypothetical protein